jgi:hypothetical protein
MAVIINFQEYVKSRNITVKNENVENDSSQNGRILYFKREEAIEQ